MRSNCRIICIVMLHLYGTREDTMGENNFLPKHKLPQNKATYPEKSPYFSQSQKLNYKKGGCQNPSFKGMRKRVPRDYYDHETRPPTILQGRYHSSLNGTLSKKRGREQQIHNFRDLSIIIEPSVRFSSRPVKPLGHLRHQGWIGLRSNHS